MSHLDPDPTDRFLTYNPARRQQWVEHDVFPWKAINYWRDGLPSGTRKFPPSTVEFRVYRFCPMACHLFEIPGDDWDDYAT